MSVEGLLHTLEAEGRARAQEARAQAEQERTRILAEASEARARAMSDAMRVVETEARQALGARLASARAEARGRVLEARQQLLGRVFDEARAHLGNALDDPAAHAALVSRAESALHHLPEGPATIRCSESVAPVLEQALTGREDLRIEIDEEVLHGFRAIGAGGKLEVDATLETLLETHRPTLAIDVMQRLEGLWSS